MNRSGEKVIVRQKWKSQISADNSVTIICTLKRKGVAAGENLNAFSY